MASINAEKSAWSRFKELTNLCDFFLVCGDNKWEVHRVVISAHSKVLERACAGDFQEASDRNIDLSEYSPGLVDALVEYLYCFDYAANPQTMRFPFGTTAPDHVQMYIVGDKYDIQPLKRIAQEKFDKAILVQGCSAKQFADATRYAHDASLVTKDIRAEIVRKDLEDQELGLSQAKNEFEDVMMEYPELAVAMAKAAKASSSSQSTPHTAPEMAHFRCPDRIFCKERF